MFKVTCFNIFLCVGIGNDPFFNSLFFPEKSSFLDEKFLEDNTVSWKNWSCDLDYMRSRKCEKSDFSFEGGHMQKRRSIFN